MASVVIAGLGVSGLACALELTRKEIPFVAFEKDDRPGGLARTEAVGEFRLDYGPHILLGVSPELRQWLAGLPGLELGVCSGRSCIALGDDLTGAVPAPFQKHLNYLPLLARVKLLSELLTRTRRYKKPANYGDFAEVQCGSRICEMFVRNYEYKRLRFSLERIPPDWTGRLEAPSLASLLTPRWISHRRESETRESRFLYPRSGGIEALPRAMASLLPVRSIRYGNRIMEIDPVARRVVPEYGQPMHYEHLVISLPLPEIVTALKDPPPAVREAAKNLLYTSIYVTSLGVEGPTPPWSLIRFPAAGVGFYRLSFPSHYSQTCAPPGLSLIVGETSHHASRHKISPAKAMEDFHTGLQRLGILQPGQKVVVENLRDVRCGHVLYNHRTRAALAVIREYLHSHGILPCGKYGTWRDMLMTDSMVSGMEAARTIAGYAEKQVEEPMFPDSR